MACDAVKHFCTKYPFFQIIKEKPGLLRLVHFCWVFHTGRAGVRFPGIARVVVSDVCTLEASLFSHPKSPPHIVAVTPWFYGRILLYGRRRF